MISSIDIMFGVIILYLFSKSLFQDRKIHNLMMVQNEIIKGKYNTHNKACANNGNKND